MRIEEIVVVTITLGRTPVEERVLLQALQTLEQTEMPVIASDGGSRKVFVTRLNNLGIQVVSPRARALVPQVKAGFRAALKRFPGRFILYTEPDKLPFFTRGILEFIQQVRRSPNLGMVIPARTQRSFRTFPSGQRWAETFTNQAAEIYFGQKESEPKDYCYGPMLLSPESVELSLASPDHLGWGWRFFTMARARQKKLQLKTIPGDFPCPVQQRRENSQADQIYRLRQLRENLAALHVAHTNENPSRKGRTG
jgi:hypothetical protein